MTTLLTTADQFVDRLLATENAARRRALIDRHGLNADQRREAVLRLRQAADPLFTTDPRRMERICVDALALAEAAAEPHLVALTQMHLGDALRGQGRNAEACAWFDRAAAGFNRIGAIVEAARTRIGWVECAAKLGRIDAALAAARAARRLFLRHGEMLRVANLEMSVGSLCVQTGDYKAALRSFTRATLLFEALGERGRAGAARGYQNRGAVLVSMGRQREALAQFERARLIFEALGDSGGIARALTNTGRSRLALGNHTAALRDLESGLAMSRADGIGARDGALQLCHIADCYLVLNRPADALRALQGVGEAAQIDSVSDLAAVAARRIIAYLRLGNLEQANDLIEGVMSRLPAVDRANRAWLATQRARIALAERDAPAALAWTIQAQRDAIATGDRNLTADASVVQAETYLDLNRLPEAQRSAERARKLARSITATPLLYRAHEALGRIAEAGGEPRRAMRQYAAAIEQLEREQGSVIFEFRESFASDRGRAFARLATLQVSHGRSAEAFATVEKAKSRALADALRGGIPLRPKGGGAIGRLARQLTRAREEYAAASNLAVACLSTPDPTQANVVATLEARIASLIQKMQIAGAADAAGAVGSYGPTEGIAIPTLPAATALVEFFFSGAELLRFIVADGAVKAVNLGAVGPQVERLVRAFRLNVEAAERADAADLHGFEGQARTVLNRLHALLLSGLPELNDLRALVVAPHGLLHYLPFQALHDGEGFLVERLAISHAPSASVHALCRGRHSRRQGALVLANSSGGALPHTTAEAQAVAAILGATVYTEGRATRETLEAEGRNAAIIHIAAHGQFRPDAPLFSRIELADGPLTTADVFGMKLRAALVSLSACETGRAALGGGDELAGLVRAFLYAGASGLLVSQWRVQDATTAAMIARFYNEVAGGAGLATALQRAQLAQLSGGMAENRTSHPFFWAGFQIIGDDRPIDSASNSRGRGKQ